MMKQDKEYIDEVIKECDEMSKDILSRMFRRAVKNMNKLDSYLAGSSDDYPSNFTFFDILTIELETRTYEEINPFLQDYIEGVVISEYENLPKQERFIVDHSDYFEENTNDIENKIIREFNAFRIEHVNTKKIENYLLKH